MPLYEFRCKSCGLKFEELLFHGGTQGVLCPRCSGEAERMPSVFSISVPDAVCAKLPTGEQRELCTECKQGGTACPFSG